MDIAGGLAHLGPSERRPGRRRQGAARNGRLRLPDPAGDARRRHLDRCVAFAHLAHLALHDRHVQRRLDRRRRGGADGRRVLLAPRRLPPGGLPALLRVVAPGGHLHAGAADRGRESGGGSGDYVTEYAFALGAPGSLLFSDWSSKARVSRETDGTRLRRAGCRPLKPPARVQLSGPLGTVQVKRAWTGTLERGVVPGRRRGADTPLTRPPRVPRARASRCGFPIRSVLPGR